MIKLAGLVTLKPITEAETFTATNKKSGKTVVFKSKDARDSAVKSGSHEMRKDDKNGGVKDPTKKDTPKVNIFDKPKKDKEQPKSQTSNSFSDDDIEDALEDSVQFDDFLDSNKDKVSKEDFLTLKSLKGAIQALEGDIVDAEMDDDEEQVDEYEQELEGEISKVKDILDKYKTTSSKKDTSQKSNTSNDDVKNFLSNKGEHDSIDFRKFGNSMKNQFTPKQEKEYNNLLNALGKANYDENESDIKNAKDKLYDFITGIEEPQNKTKSTEKGTSGPSATLKNSIKKTVTKGRKGNLSPSDLKDFGTEIADDLTPEQKAEYDKLVNNLFQANRAYNNAPDDEAYFKASNAYDKAYDTIYDYLDSIIKPKENTTIKLKDLLPVKEAPEDRYVSIGFGKYKEKGKEDDENAPTFEKDGNKFVPISTHKAAAKDSDDTKDDKPKVNIFNKDKEEPKSEPKDSSGGRAGNPQVNKAVRKKAEQIGLTPSKLGREEYELRMVQAAHEALTDSNFHSEARKLIAIIEDNPELAKNPADDPNKPDLGEPGYEEWQKGTAWGSKYGDSSEGTDELGQAAASEAGWAGKDALDGIAFELKMRGFKDLAAKIQSVFDDEKNESSMRLTKMEYKRREQ